MIRFSDKCDQTCWLAKALQSLSLSERMCMCEMHEYVRNKRVLCMQLW